MRPTAAGRPAGRRAKYSDHFMRSHFNRSEHVRANACGSHCVRGQAALAMLEFVYHHNIRQARPCREAPQFPSQSSGPGLPFAPKSSNRLPRKRAPGPQVVLEAAPNYTVQCVLTANPQRPARLSCFIKAHESRIFAYRRMARWDVTWAGHPA